MSTESLIRLPEYFPSLINAMQDGFVLRDTDGAIIEANRAFCEMTGLDRSEVTGARPPYPWWPEEERDVIEQAMSRYLAGQTADDDLIYMRKTGERFPVSLTSSPLTDAEGRIVAYIGMIKDMTERKHAEQQIQFQAKLIDQVQAAVIATDPVGNVTLWNQGAEDLYGWSHDEAIGRNIRELTITEESAGQAEQIMRQLAQGEVWEGEFTCRHKDGSTVLTFVSDAPILDHDGQLAGVVGVSVDLTERKRAEQRLEAQYAVTRALADANTLAEGLQAALDAIGRHLDWQLGAFWVVDAVNSVLRCAGIWRAPGLEAAEFDVICRDTVFHPGEGLPGRTWIARRPIWMRDIAVDVDQGRVGNAANLGFRSAICLPVQIGRHVIGVIEYFSDDIREPDADRVNAFTTIGAQIGQFIERKRAEAAMRESEERFRTMANSAPVLLWMSGPDAQLTWFNTGWLEFTGRTMEQEVGNGWAEGIHPADVGRCLDTYHSSFEARQPFTMEYRLRRRDGEYRWIIDNGVPRFEPDGSVAGYIGSCIDIHDRKRAEEDQRFLSEATRILASSLDYHATLTNVAELAVPRIADWCSVHVVADDGGVSQIAVAHVNPAKVAWARELQVRYPFDKDAPYGAPKVLRTGEPEIYPVITEAQIEAIARDPEHLEMLRAVGFTSAMVVPIIARGRTMGAITLVSAESGRRYGADDLALAQELAGRSAVAIDNARLYMEAQQAARARDQFLAVAAHELRSPLTSMKGFAQLLVRRATRASHGEQWIQPLRTIDTQVNRVTELVNRLLDVTRIEEKRLRLQVEQGDIGGVVRTAAYEAELATEGHLVVTEISDEPLTAEFDRMRLQQVLSNLLDNAVKYSPVGSTVALRAWREDDEIRISVRDEGPGIPREMQPRLFERYFRGVAATRAASEGLGLGLYVAYGIVEAHGGRIWVDSDTGAGATFCIALPSGARAE